MKKIMMLLYTAIVANQLITAQVAINTDGTAPNSSAMLDIKSTTKGLLTPRMTTAQRTAIASPATGLMVYDTDLNKFFYYAIGSWIEMGTGSATNYWTQNGINIYNNNSGYVGIGTDAPDYKLTINQTFVESNTNTHVLRLKGRNPVLAFSDENNNSYGYIKMWSYQPFAPYTNGMVIGANPGYPIFLSTNNYGATMTIADNGKVGVGTTLPDFKLTVFETQIQGNTNTHVLKLKGQNPVLAFADQNENSYGYIKMWSAFTTPPYTNGMVIGANPGYPIFLSTNNYGATMTIADNGNVGINTTTPLAKLHIAQDNEALRISGNQSYLTFYNGATYKGYLWNKGTNGIELATAVGNTTGDLSLGVQGNPHLTVQGDGRVRVGALGCNIPVLNSQFSQLPKFSVHGPIGLKKSWLDESGEWAIFYSVQNYGPDNYFDVLAFHYNGGWKAFIDDDDGDYISTSDSRLKENFENYKSVLNGIKKLDVLTYHYKADKTGRRSFGLVAQNLKQYFPELVSGSEDKGNYLGISYAKTGVLAIKAIQEQQLIIEEQQKRIELLEKRLSALENKLR